MPIMEWFKVNGYNYVYGSLRIDTPIERLVFVELLALASISRVRRTVCLSDGVAYPRPMLAALIGIGEPELNAAIAHHSKPDLGRLQLNDWGGIEIVKWDKYQSKSYDRVRKFREKKQTVTPDTVSCNADVTPDTVSCNGREENRREENRIETEKPSVAAQHILSEDELIFDNARGVYPGVKRGCLTEFGDFCKKHKDWREILPILKDAIEMQVLRRSRVDPKEFVPQWKNFKTWLNQRCWEARI